MIGADDAHVGLGAQDGSGDPVATSRSAGRGARAGRGGSFLDDIAGQLGDVDGAAALAADPADRGGVFSMLDLVGLPDDEAALARHVLRSRRRPTVESAAEALGWDLTEAERVLTLLVDRGAVTVVDGEIRPAQWRVQRATPEGLWSRLGDL